MAFIQEGFIFNSIAMNMEKEKSETLYNLMRHHLNVRHGKCIQTAISWSHE